MIRKFVATVPGNELVRVVHNLGTADIVVDIRFVDSRMPSLSGYVQDTEDSIMVNVPEPCTVVVMG